MSKSWWVLVLLIGSTTAQAEWLEASSDHFVVYGDTNEQNLRRFAEQLERYDSAMSVISGTPRRKPSRSARVTIYAVGSDSDLRKLAAQNGTESRNTAGFYIPAMAGPIAFVPKVTAARNGDDELDFNTIILLHEYAHHFAFLNSRFTAPRWYIEGSAEFFSSASFQGDGSVTLGRAAKHRSAELFALPDVTVTDLVDPEHYQKRRGGDQRYDAYYGRAWLLFHYLTFEPTRLQQRRAYIQAMLTGKSSRQAAEEAFGDLDKLNKELDAYMIRRSFKHVTLKGSVLTTGDITVRSLSAGEAAIMPVVMRSRRGVGSKELAAEIVAEARALATQFPADSAVHAALAEAEFDADNYAAAVAAADAALTVDPRNVSAHVQKVYASFGIAEKAETAAGVDEARRALLTLNSLEPNHPVPLVYFYRSFQVRGETVTANAVAGLEQAAAVAPFAHDISLMLAQQYLVDDKIAQARETLLPVAYNPHGGKRAEKLRELLVRLEGAEKIDAAAIADALRDLDKPESVPVRAAP